MAKHKIKKNVEVEVIAGSHKGTVGKVISISKDRQKVVVDKVNIVKKHNKPTQQNPDGGIQEFEAPIHISNLKVAVKKSKKNKRDEVKHKKEEAKNNKKEVKNKEKAEQVKNKKEQLKNKEEGKQVKTPHVELVTKKVIKKEESK